MTEVTVLDCAAAVARKLNKDGPLRRHTASGVREVIEALGEVVASDLRIYPTAIHARTPRDAIRSIQEALALAAVFGAVVDRVGVRRTLYHCSFDNACFHSFDDWRDLCIDFEVNYIAQKYDLLFHHLGGLDDSIVTQHDPRTGLPAYRCGNSENPGVLGKVGASFTSPAKRDRFFREFMTRAEYVKGFDGTKRSFV